jgi:hypothetical protein
LENVRFTLGQQRRGENGVVHVPIYGCATPFSRRLWRRVVDLLIVNTTKPVLGHMQYRNLIEILYIKKLWQDR